MDSYALRDVRGTQRQIDRCGLRCPKDALNGGEQTLRPTSRGTGVLLHPTSLPGPMGIGTLGQEARRFVDFLADTSMRYWQICPLGPTGCGNSPYQCFSAFAGNPYLIDLSGFVAAGLLTESDLVALHGLPGGFVDYGAQWHSRWKILRTAFDNFSKLGQAADEEEFAKFRKA